MNDLLFLKKERHLLHFFINFQKRYIISSPKRGDIKIRSFISAEKKIAKSQKSETKLTFKTESQEDYMNVKRVTFVADKLFESFEKKFVMT